MLVLLVVVVGGAVVVVGAGVVVVGISNKKTKANQLDTSVPNMNVWGDTWETDIQTKYIVTSVNQMAC